MAEYSGFDLVLVAENSETTSAEARTREESDRKAAQPRRGKGAAKEPALSREQMRRQGDATHAAFVALGQAGAIAFLNGRDEKLAGRPLDIASDSEEGLQAVRDRLKDYAALG